jgi:hypothetical protein
MHRGRWPGPGGTTLEQPMERRGSELPKGDADDPQLVEVWQEASAAYADGASGEVRAVIGDNLTRDPPEPDEESR